MKKLKYVGIFMLVFLIYHSIGCKFFPVDDSNTLLAPGWYAPVGIALSVIITYFVCKMQKKRAKSSDANRLKSEQDSISESSIVSELDDEELIPLSPANDSDIPEYDALNTVKQMEIDFETTYKFVYDRMLNAQDCQRAFDLLCQRWGSSSHTVPVQIRFEQLKKEYQDKFQNPNPLLIVDNMAGHDFEYWCANLLRKNGFTNVNVTPGSGDQGVDVLAVKDGIHYAIQCKCYHSDLGNTPVQEVYAGKEFYRCQVGVVMTNRGFTSGAKELANHTRVLLWDRNKLKEMLAVAGEFIEPETTTNECAQSSIDDMFF